MRFVPYHRLAGIPNIIVDGAAHPDTRLTLSHWPQSGTSWNLKADLSAQIVFKYLDTPAAQVSVEAVSNNHFDEDGLIGIYTILNPHTAEEKRDLLIDIAAAGDFGTYRFRDAARISFVIAAHADASASPLSHDVFKSPYPETAAALYAEMLERLPEILAHPECFRQFWDSADAELSSTEEAIRAGAIKIEEHPELDLAVVSGPELATYHPMAIHNATNCSRILQMRGSHYKFTFRYESWVQYISRRVLPRVDLTPLAERFSDLEGKRWHFDGVDEIVPSLSMEDGSSSRIAPAVFRGEMENFLRSAPPAWNPFDPR